MSKRFALAFGLFIFLTMSTNCTYKYGLYQSSTQKIVGDVQFNSMVEEIRNNFFYNKKDSIYFENILLFPNIENQYYDIFHQLDKESVRKIFGEPHYEDSILIGYVVKKVKFPNNPDVAYERFFSFKNDKLQMVVHSPLNIERDIDFNVNRMIGKVYKHNQTLPMIDFIGHKAKNISVEAYDQYCRITQKNMRGEIFFNNKTNCYIINTFIGEPMQNWEREKCTEQFSINEIKLLFGNPSLVKRDTLLYKLDIKPFLEQSKIGTKYNDGKYPYFYFSKIKESQKYQIGTVIYEK